MSLVQFYNENFKPASAYLSVEKAAEESRVSVALQYADDKLFSHRRIANNIGESEGGTHHWL